MTHYTGKINATSPGGLAVIADSSLTPQSDADGREGWLFHKTTTGSEKFNLYYYSDGSRAMTVSQLKSLKATVSIDNYQGMSSLPFFVVYTKATGTGDAQVWYHSRRAYTLTSTETIMNGEQIEMFALESPAKLNGKRQVQFNTTTTDGDYEDNEEILYITLQSDSAAPQNSKILVQSMGENFINGQKIDINFKLEYS